MITRSLNGKNWTAAASNSSELETQEFLYGLVRVLKPEVCVETGCFQGEASAQIALALDYNGHGHLYTCDVDPQAVVKVSAIVEKLPATVYCRDSVEMLRRIPEVDFAFIDGGSNRTAEMEALQLSSHAYVVLHDANNPDYLFPRKWSKEFAKSLQILRFPHPLGLAVFEVKR